MSRRTLPVLVAVVLLVFGVTTASASARPAAGGPGTQPLPGYTVDNPKLAPLTVDGATTRVVQGVYDHSAFDVEIPAHWNGQLVMWAHGYRGFTSTLTVDPPDFGLRALFVRQGYAWAASSYVDTGYDVRAGVASTHSLARHFTAIVHRRPSRIYIAGVSMGGQIIGRSLEQYPKYYSGALPMCGVLGDNRLFDFFLDYNLVAQDLSGIHDYPVTGAYPSDVPKIESKLGIASLSPGENPTSARGRQLQAITVERSGGPRPGADASFSIWKDFLFSLAMPDNGGDLSINPGRLAQNVGQQYTPNTPVDVNATVQRVSASNPVARRTTAFTQIPRILGDPQVPVLTLHGLGDMFVPFSMEQIYAREVAAHGESNLLVQRAVREAGHCEYTPREAGNAWNALTKWVQAGGAKAPAADRPAGDNVLSRRGVASPTYGCRFTDQTAYQHPDLYPTRALFAPCP